MKAFTHAQDGCIPVPAQFLLLTVLAALPFAVLGCATDSGFGGDPTSGVYVTPDRMLDQARRDLNAGRYDVAIHRLLDVLSHGASAPEAQEARFLLAKAHLETGGYVDAQQHLWAYLQKAPEGSVRRKEAEEMLAVAEAETGDHRVTRATLATQAEAARETLSKAPDIPENWVNLADIQWQLGRYDDAAASYGTLITRWPEYATRPPVPDRVELGDDGRYYPVTPEVARQRAYEAEPLVVYGLNSYTSNKKGWLSQSAEDDFYHVTGIVKNRSTKPLRNVTVEVRLYGAVANLFDVQTYRAGDMPPGADKAFALRFGNFDTIHNVNRHEIRTSFDRDGGR